MPIKTEDRFFGEGIDEKNGVADAATALKHHKAAIRQKHVADVLAINHVQDDAVEDNEDCYLSYIIVKYYDALKAAIDRADKQVYEDNQEFLNDHKLKVKG